MSSSTSSSASAAKSLNHAHSIVITPQNPRVLYLGAHYRLYKSSNGGNSWHPLLNQMMLSLTMDPTHPSTLWGVSSKRGLLRTTNGGHTWIPIGDNIAPGKVTGVVYDPQHHALLAYGVGIYRSTDAGLRWHRVVKSQSIASLAVGGNGTVYAASDAGLTVSQNGGRTWRAVRGQNQPFVQVAASNSTVYAVGAVSLLKSSNNGYTWSALAKAPQGIEFLGASPTDAREVVAEIGGWGMRYSHDGGLTWHAGTHGIHDTNFNGSTIRVAPSSPNIVYTAAWGLHFYASHDGGRDWIKTATLLK